MKSKWRSSISNENFMFKLKRVKYKIHTRFQKLSIKKKKRMSNISLIFLIDYMMT